MTDKNETTTHPGADVKEVIKNCGCDCASMMARFCQSHSDGETEEDKGTKKGCC